MSFDSDYSAGERPRPLTQPAGPGEGDPGSSNGGRVRLVITVLRGVFALTLALALLLGGDGAGRILANFIGFYILADSLATLRSRQSSGRGARLQGLAGALGTVAGVAVVTRSALERFIPQAELLQIVGVLAMLVGWTRLLGGFATPGTVEPIRLAESLLMGGFEMLLGGVLIFAPPADGARAPVEIIPVLIGWAFIGAGTLFTDAWRQWAAMRGRRPASGVPDESGDLRDVA
jgi:hypothetical protein